jgi:nitroreductase
MHSLVSTLLQSRQTILPKRLVAPGPDDQQLANLLHAAGSAPDHKQLTPWRFVLIPPDARGLLAEQFVLALLERDVLALPAEVEQAREKAFRSPLLMLAVVDGGRGDSQVDLSERIVSAGCAIQNLLLMATAMGFGSALTSGKALKFAGLRKLFDLNPHERALCFISVGTVKSRKPQRLRPSLGDYVQCLTTTQGVVPYSGPPAAELG